MSAGDRRTKCIGARTRKSENRGKWGPLKSNYREANKVGSFKKRETVQIVDVLKCLLL